MFYLAGDTQNKAYLAGFKKGLSGLILGVLFLATKRNLTVPILAHGVSNTLAFILIYFGRYPGLG